MNNIKIELKNFQALLIPILVMVLIIALIVTSVKIIFDNAGSLNAKIQESNKMSDVLQGKLTSLQILTPTISTNSEIAAIAMPGTDSVLTTLSQLKSNATSSNLLLTSISSANNVTVEGGDLNSSIISFEIESQQYSDIFSFVTKMKNSLPITRFDLFEISESDLTGSSGYKFEGSLISFWAPLPLTIPALTEPIVELTTEERDVLTKLSSKTKPVFDTSDQSVATASGKVNPFQ